MGNKRSLTTAEENVALRFALQRARERLRSERVTQGITQRNLADIMSASQGTVAEYELGRLINPTLLTLVRWARALGFNVRITLERRETRDRQ